MKKRVFLKVLSLVMLLIGVFLLINSGLNVTGAFLGSKGLTILASFSAGMIILFVSIILFSSASLTLEKMAVTSSIKSHPSLLRLTQDAVRDQLIEREMNHLIEELYKGNLEAGLGHPGHVEGTKVHYLRGRNGARLYYQRKGEQSYEIVAKSAKGRNQEQVINKIKDIYD